MSASRSLQEVRRSLEDNRGDLNAVAAMMERSWRETRNSPLLYTSEFLESSLAYPGAGPALAPTIYHGSDPVAFVAGLPRRIRYHGLEFDVLLITFLTVAPEQKNRGYGIALWSELVARAQKAGFNGMVNYCVEGDAMNDMIAGACARLHLPVQRVYSAQYLTKVLLRKPSAHDTVAVAPETLISAAEWATSGIPLARRWSTAEAEWQCTRVGAVGAATDAAVLTGYVQPVSNPSRAGCLLVEDILWNRVAREERVRLLQALIDRSLATGARLAVVPLLGYADMSPFEELGFRGSGRVVHAYLTLWGETPAPETVSSFYLDVT